jgi:hypothetical protein
MKPLNSFDKVKMFLSLLYSMQIMKPVRTTFVIIFFSLVFSSCSVFSKPKYGCGDNGKNVGAEKLLDGSQKKSPKFKV